MQLRFLRGPFVVQSLIMGLMAFVQFKTGMWTSHMLLVTSADQIALYVLGFGGVNAAVMFAGDRLARKRGLWRRRYYLGLGAIAATVTHVVALAPEGYVAAARDGVLVFLLALPPLLGAATAFLLYRNLGFATDGDDPALLAPQAGAAPVSQAGAGVVTVGDARYFDGPLQIRTSNMAAFIAALLGSALYSLISVFSLFDGALPPGAMPPVFRHNPALGALMGMASCTLPFLFFVHQSHKFLQARGKTAIGSYALAGVVVPLGFAAALLALMGPFGVILVLPWILPSVLAMVTYHQLAGLEPLALPDDIEVSDPRTLIPADHVRRRVRRVIPTE